MQLRQRDRSVQVLPGNKIGHLGADVWGIVGVAQLSGDVEAELLTVLYSCVAQPDAQSSALRYTDSHENRT